MICTLSREAVAAIRAMSGNVLAERTAFRCIANEWWDALSAAVAYYNSLPHFTWTLHGCLDKIFGELDTTCTISVQVNTVDVVVIASENCWQALRAMLQHSTFEDPVLNAELRALQARLPEHPFTVCAGHLHLPADRFRSESPPLVHL